MTKKVGVKIHDHQKKVIKVEKIFEKAIVNSEKIIDNMIMEREEVEETIIDLTHEKEVLDTQIDRSIAFTNNLKQLLGYDHEVKVNEEEKKK